MLAVFLNPALMYGGAAAVSIPILIHLLARRRFKRIRWAAMEFLLHAQRRNRRRLRMEEWILLALRCAAIAALGAMFARPFLEPAGLAASLRRSQRVDRILVIDDSFSMAYESSEGTAFARAKEGVRRILDSIQRESPDDAISLYRMSAPEEPLETGVFLAGPQADALRAKLEALQVTQRGLEPGPVVRAVADQLSTRPDVMAVALYVVSDFQRKDWVLPGASGAVGGAAELFSPMTEWAKRHRGFRVVLVDIGEDDRPNTAITAATMETGQVVAGAGAVLRVTLGNVGLLSRDDLELQTAIGNVPQASKTLRALIPGQMVSVDVDVEFHRPGFETVRLDLPRDRLPLDDTRYLAVEAVSAVRILLVNGEPSTDAYSDEIAYLGTALRPEGELFSGNEVSVVEESEFESTPLSNSHLVALANVYRLSDAAVEALERFVRSGGGAIFFLGDQVDADAYNTGLFRNGAGLLPGLLTEIRHPTEAVHLRVTDRLHPALRGVAGDGDPLGLGQVPFLEFVGCKPFAGESRDEESTATPKSLTPAPQAPATSNDSVATPGARVLAEFDDADRSPAVVERAFGAGRVVLMTTTADKEWHLWPDHPTFLPVMMELARHVARRAGSDEDRLVGKPIVVPLDPAESEPEAFVRSPAFPNEPEASIRAAAIEDGSGLELRWPHTESAGIYQIVTRRHDGTERIRAVAVNVDPRESDLTGATEDELRRALPGIRFEYVKGLRGLSDATVEARVEIWRWLWALAAAALVFEQGLAWFWGQRR